MPERVADDTVALRPPSKDHTDDFWPGAEVYPSAPLPESSSISTFFRNEREMPSTFETAPGREISKPEIALLGVNAARLRRLREAVGPGSPTPVRVTRRWMGVVQSADAGGFFEALLTPLDEIGPEVTATLSLDAVSDDDAALIAPGVSFYLHAGRTSMGPGRTIAFTSIKVRRLGRWRDEELDFIRERARKRQGGIDFE